MTVDSPIRSLARTIIDGSADAAVLLDADQRIIHFNAAYLHLTGLRPRALKDEAGVQPFRSTDGVVDLQAQRRHCLEARRPVRLAEVALENRGGERFIVLITLVPVLDEGGVVVGLLESLRDVSDEARIQARYKDMLALERTRAADLEMQVEHRTRELTVALEEVTRLSRTDPLTSLTNRRAFHEHATQALAVAKRHGRTLALFMCDLDHFKRINDTHGHQAGDAVLLSAAQSLQRAVRSSDRVGRWGGEEFAVLLPETTPEFVLDVAERCRASIRAIDLPAVAPGAKGLQTISIGAAMFPQHGQTLDALLGRADDALYHAKHNGRDRVVLYSDDVRASVQGPSAIARPSVLVLAGPLIERSGYREALEAKYEVTTVGSAEEALQACLDRRFEAIIAEETPQASGVEMLHRSLRTSPEALRVLILAQADLFLERRGANLARVDCFLMHGDVRKHLVPTLEDAKTRRDAHRQQLLQGTDSLRSVYSARIGELDQLIEAKAVAFHYQPVVSSVGRRVFGHEALCRIDHPIFVKPTVLFDAAVQSGSIWRLGRVIRHALLARLATLPPASHLFINVHPAELDDPHFSEDYQLAGSALSRVIFEITDRGAIADLDRFRRQLDHLKALGSRFAIDTLGAGYASLNAVALLNPDFIKIDMSLVREVHLSHRKAQLIRRLVDYANDAGLLAIAQGVESEDEANVLSELGCHLMQGFHLGRPAPLFAGSSPSSADNRVSTDSKPGTSSSISGLAKGS